MQSVKLGSRVYYTDNGPDDKGTIVDFVLADDDATFVVKWDKQSDDESIDRFSGKQLTLLEY